MRVRLAFATMALLAFALGCDASSPAGSAASGSSTQLSPPSSAAVQPPEAPEIIVDRVHVEIGKTRVAAGPGIAERAGVLLRGAPAIDGQTVGVIALRDASPSDVAAVIDLLRQSKAAGVDVKTEARDSTTQVVKLAISTRLPDCATVAWIAKDASIDVWPAGGGKATRILRGLAGPDLTLGAEAMRKQAGACEASELAVGADDAMSWGLVFDLAMSALHQPWTRASAALLVTGATPGRRLAPM